MKKHFYKINNKDVKTVASQNMNIVNANVYM